MTNGNKVSQSLILRQLSEVISAAYSYHFTKQSVTHKMVNFKNQITNIWVQRMQLYNMKKEYTHTFT